ncbi:ABC transporter substrate-binding protein [Candidatus Peribacteria bacterium]|nr:MAG: ABC transporter substrate-binding protein [Candidatus Peribacteria bacterium]
MVQSSRSIFQSLIRAYVRWERWIIAVLATLFVGSLLILLWRFYRQSTVLVPATGGTYIEGSVGTLQPLNPWFTVTNDVNRDIVSLIFAGLLKYNPQTRAIEEDLATYTVSKDAKTYTLTLKPNVFWQDSTEEAPHPVTADDIVFTYKTIQDPDFPNSLLRQNFRGVTINRIDDRTVSFVLDQPYGFFTSNLTLGILPQSSFKDVPVKLLDQTLDFGFNPIGAGPYKLKSIVETELSTEVTLERFERELAPEYHLERIVLRVFPDYQTLLSDLHNLDGIRLVPHTENGRPAVPNRFKAGNYTLPQYTALFFNMDRKIVQDQELRLGLQLGTNKQELAESVGESVIVDTPLLELDDTDWRYHFDPEAAAGALFQSEWYFPEKIHLQRLLEQREANQQGLLKMESVVFLDTGAVLNVSGSGGGLSGKNRVNGAPLQSNPTSSGGWIVALPTVSRGTGSIRIGLNLLKLTDEKGKIIDSFYVRRAVDAVQYQLALNEQQLVDIFLKSRAGSIPEDQRITVKDLTVEKGFLRLRRPTDVIGTRTNDAGQSLTLTLLTSPSPASYKGVAENVKKQWGRLGVDVNVVIPESRADFEDRLLKRDYDVLLFGQSLLDNLDSYPYWHSSGVQKVTGNRNDLRLDAYNLSQYQSFASDSLLETIRGTANETERTNALVKLKEVLKKDVPAIFLYSPLYTFSHRDDILGIELGHLSLHSDRFLTLGRWYVKQERVFADGTGWLSFFPWLSSLFAQE